MNYRQTYCTNTLPSSTVSKVKDLGLHGFITLICAVTTTNHTLLFAACSDCRTLSDISPDVSHTWR
jgi:hypothetical protein